MKNLCEKFIIGGGQSPQGVYVSGSAYYPWYHWRGCCVDSSGTNFKI